VAKGADMPADDLAELMFEAGFRELVGSMAELMALDDDARLKRMLRLADQIIMDALSRTDLNAALFVRREHLLKRNPRQSLAKGLSRLLQREMAKAGRLQAEIDAGRLTPDTPAPAAPVQPEPAPAAEPLLAAVEAVEAAEAMRPDRRVHRVDAAIYRKAGALRQAMLDEQLLHHAVAAQAAAERRKVPLELDELDEIEARQVALAQALTTAPEPEPELSPEDLQALDEIRAMYRKLPPDRLQNICKRPPRGMERLFAVLARENGLASWPSGP
jgi:hypothetical protein